LITEKLSEINNTQQLRITRATQKKMTQTTKTR